MASILVLVIVFVLDLIALAFAIAAETSRNIPGKVTKWKDEWYCKYGNNTASILGISAMILLLLSHLLLTPRGRCTRGFGAGASRFWAILLFIIYSVTFVTAEICLVAGVLECGFDPKYNAVFQNPPPSCGTPSMKGIFSAAAAFIGFTCICSELYHLLVNYSKCTNSNHNTTGNDTGTGVVPMCIL